jgi:hypothetical protein
MNKLRAGGYYIGTDGQPHDANGNPIAVDLPEAFPARTVLIGAGLPTLADVQATDLSALVDKATLAKIKTALAEQDKV